MKCSCLEVLVVARQQLGMKAVVLWAVLCALLDSSELVGWPSLFASVFVEYSTCSQAAGSGCCGC